MSSSVPRNFAITGVSGFVAPRHLEAIRATGNRVVAATDPHDAAGLLDRYSFDVRFFPEIERFDRHLEKLRRGPEEHRLHYLSICAPNYLHDAHIRMALRVGADAICEKPIVINPWNLDALQELEKETGGRVNTILQLRLHPVIAALRQRIQSGDPRHRYRVKLPMSPRAGRGTRSPGKAARNVRAGWPRTSASTSSTCCSGGSDRCSAWTCTCATSGARAARSNSSGRT
jgi:UDP-N-acetyl-2-amino-2-deoxyglucuronate dehydrogenase